jgi:Ribonuclease G/E
MDEDKREQFALDEVAAEIKAVAEQLKDVEAQIEQARAAHDKDEVAALRKKEEQLRTEKEQLRKKEEQLRTEKEQLRAKELLLLQRQAGALKRLRHRYADSSRFCADTPSCVRSRLKPCTCVRGPRVGEHHRAHRGHDSTGTWPGTLHR